MYQLYVRMCMFTRLRLLNFYCGKHAQFYYKTKIIVKEFLGFQFISFAAFELKILKQISVKMLVSDYCKKLIMHMLVFRDLISIGALPTFCYF